MQGGEKILAARVASTRRIRAHTLTRLISLAAHVRAWRRLKTRFETKIEIEVETLSFHFVRPFIERHPPNVLPEIWISTTCRSPPLTIRDRDFSRIVSDKSFVKFLTNNYFQLFTTCELSCNHRGSRFLTNRLYNSWQIIFNFQPVRIKSSDQSLVQFLTNK